MSWQTTASHMPPITSVLLQSPRSQISTTQWTRLSPAICATRFPTAPKPPSASSTRRLDADPAFVRSVAGVSEPTAGTLDTDAGPVRYAAIPVSMAGDSSRGVLVAVVFQDELADPLYESVRIFAIVAVAALILAGLASWRIAGRVLAPIRLVRQTAEQIGESDLRRRIPVRGTDDVARLAGTFNQMLDRLEVAFDAQREFVDDAGHELRTPITVIRGHL